MQAPIDTNFIALAHRMADASGEILRRCFRTTLNIESKSDLSPVTMTDREVETALRTLIEESYPEHGIIGEEFGNVRPQSPWQWVLDPIDGTHAFIAEEATFTTLIALAYEGVPLLGVIDQPILRERWVGAAEKTTLFSPSPNRGQAGWGALQDGSSPKSPHPNPPPNGEGIVLRHFSRGIGHVSIIFQFGFFDVKSRSNNQ